MRESMNKSTFWRPYICSLPNYVPLPVFYSPSKLERVRQSVPEEQWPNLDNLIEARRDTIELKFASIFPVLFRGSADSATLACAPRPLHGIRIIARLSLSSLPETNYCLNV